MKITESQLRNIIKQELKQIFEQNQERDNEARMLMPIFEQLIDLWRDKDTTNRGYYMKFLEAQASSLDPNKQKQAADKLKQALQTQISTSMEDIQKIIEIKEATTFNNMVYGAYIVFMLNNKQYKFNYTPSFATIVDTQTNQIILRQASPFRR